MTLELFARAFAALGGAITAGLAWFGQFGRRRVRADLLEDLNIRDRLREGSTARALLEQDIERRVEQLLVPQADDLDDRKRRSPTGIASSIFCLAFTPVAAYFAWWHDGLHAGWSALAIFLPISGMVTLTESIQRRERDAWDRAID